MGLYLGNGGSSQTCVFDFDGEREVEVIPADQFAAMGCPPESGQGYYPLKYSHPGEPTAEDYNYQSPPYVPAGTGEPFPEKPPYTLPVEIFNHPGFPIPVSMPVPENMPIPTTLPEPPAGPIEQAGISPLLVGALVIGGLLALGGGAATRKRRKS